MAIREVDRRWGGTATKWVWSARPRYMFDEDGSERAVLEPVDEVLPTDYTDETGWWTCHRDTKMHDLAVMYRNAGKKDPEPYPVEGPKDLCYVCLAVSCALPLAEDPLAGEFSEHYGCRFVVVARFEPSIGIGELRADAITRDWGALKAGFVQAAMPMPDEVWHRLVEMGTTERPAAVLGRRRKPRLPEGERRRLEQRLEDWLESNPHELRRVVGFDVVVHQRQMLCTPDHDGTIDLLCRRADQSRRHLVVELKVEEVKRDAVAQVLGYVGWLRAQPDVDNATALIIGLEPHVQVPWVLETLPEGLVQTAHWDKLDLPDDLASELGLHA